MGTPKRAESGADADGGDPWVEIRVKIPASWKAWLDEAAQARALTLSALVRQCIRGLMIQRHNQEGT